MAIARRLAALSKTTRATLLVGALLLVPAIGDRVGSFNHVVLMVAALVAATAVWTASDREVDPWHPERRGWTIITAGLVAAALSDAAYLVQWRVNGELEFPSPGDAIWIAAEILLLVGVLSVPHPVYSGRTRVKLHLDQITGVVALLSLAWIAYLSRLLESELVSTGLFGEILAAAFTVVDIIALVSVLILTTRRGPHRFEPAMLALTWAVVLTSVGNMTTAAVAEITGETSAEFAWVNGFYVLSLGAFLAAADAVRHRGLLRSSTSAELAPKVVFAPYVMVAILVGAYVLRLIGSVQAFDDALAQIALLLIAGLVITRQSVAIGETRDYMERQRNEMVASVSHELRTPLTAVSGFSAMLTEQWGEYDDLTRREFVSYIDLHSARLARIVQDLIELARNELETVELRPAPIRVAVLITEAINSVEVAHDVTNRIVPDVPLDLMVEADRGRITQIIGNLISNAIKYGHGRVGVTARAHGDLVSISVADDGDGVPEKWVAAIFDRFERGAHRFDSAVPGSGLGLPISRALAVAHGGTITVGRSRDLGGAEFTLELPRSVAKTQSSTTVGSLPA